MAYWDFGPDATGYSEAVTIDNLSGTPTFSLAAYSPSLKDGNGKDGTAYTDPDGAPHTAGQAAAIDEAYPNAGEILVSLSGTGFQLTQWRWDAYTDDAGGSRGPTSFDVSYSVNGGEGWVTIAQDVDFQRNENKDEYYAYQYDLSGYSALSDAATVLLRLNDFKNGTAGAFAFDNMLVAGHTVGAPALTLTPETDLYYVRPGDTISLTASVTEPDGDMVSLTGQKLPVGAIFTNKNTLAPFSSDFYWQPQTSGYYQFGFTATDAQGSDSKSVEVYVMREQCALMLNEANAVGSSTNLEVPDAAFTSPIGNGGNWIELMVLEDHLDIRGWQIQWAETGDASNISEDFWYGDPSVLQGIITFSQDAALSDLRKGALLTIIEHAVPFAAGGTAVTDISVDPEAGDWWMHLCATQEVALGNRYLSTQSNNSTNQGDFSVGASDWQMRILDADGFMVAPPVGEGINGCEAGVSKTEVLALKDTFDASMRDASEYTDRDYSSFGQLNVVDDETG
ncbi:MAG: hypothetical protein EOM20_20865, partial [Spartobacteria bacterium]|nr:hypothetical protein [Spartobacteria bacterium]